MLNRKTGTALVKLLRVCIVKVELIRWSISWDFPPHGNVIYTRNLKRRNERDAVQLNQVSVLCMSFRWVAGCSLLLVMWKNVGICGYVGYLSSSSSSTTELNQLQESSLLLRSLRRLTDCTEIQEGQTEPNWNRKSRSGWMDVCGE